MGSITLYIGTGQTSAQHAVPAAKTNVMSIHVYIM